MTGCMERNGCLWPWPCDGRAKKWEPHAGVRVNLGTFRDSVVAASGKGNSAMMACSVARTKESRPKTIEAGSVGGPMTIPFHSNDEAEISAVLACGRC